jgi:hypothetical protein
MKTAVDSSVLLDVLGADPRFGGRSREALRAAYDAGALVACDVVWAEVRAHFPSDAEFEQAVGLLGIRFEPIQFTPTGDRYAGVLCGGVRLVVTDREAVRPVTVGLALATALRERHRDQFRGESIQNLLVNRSTMWAFLRGEPLERLLAWAEVDRSSFLNRRASYLIYR